jgi:hypothetical protein
MVMIRGSVHIEMVNAQAEPMFGFPRRTPGSAADLAQMLREALDGSAGKTENSATPPALVTATMH